jgi:L-amino acid N-acyltransferase
MRFIDCNFDMHAAPILEIFNDAILNSTALYEYKPRTLQTMELWFKAKATGAYPVIAAIGNDDQFLGFASYGPFRTFPAFKYSVEHSVYVHANSRGQGVGKALLQEIARVAQNNDVHVMVGGIDAANHASISLHQQLGFVHSGTITESGFKFGRWLDLAFYQLTLKTPTTPVDG